MATAIIKDGFTVVCPVCGYAEECGVYAVAHANETLFGKCKGCGAELIVRANSLGRKGE